MLTACTQVFRDENGIRCVYIQKRAQQLSDKENQMMTYMKNDRTIVHRDDDGFYFVLYGKVTVSDLDSTLNTKYFYIEDEALLKHEGPNGEPGIFEHMILSKGWWSSSYSPIGQHINY